MDYLASVTDLKVFGCSIDFLQTATQTDLEDPIWDRLEQGMAYTVVFKNSSVTLSSRNNSTVAPSIRFRLPFMSPNREEIVPEGAFFAGVPRLRHVVLSQASGSLEQRPGKIADNFASSNCRPQW